MSRSHIANTIRLLQLPVEVQGLIAEGRIQAGHGRALLSLGDAEAQRLLALRVAAEDVSVRELEELVRNTLEHATPGEPAARLAAVPAPEVNPLAEVEEILAEQLATRVSIQMSRKRGRIVIEFGSADDLERIVSEIVGSGPGLAPE
jgi:ParB family chromosome partitioning protein